jgi:hypothetical protein
LTTASPSDRLNAQDSPLVVKEILDGQGLSLSQAARLIPPNRNNKPTAPATLWRWHRAGCKGPDGKLIRLECARVGCRLMTSRDAMSRFLAALNPVAPDHTAGRQQPGSRHSAESQTRAARVAQAEAELSKRGL